MNDKADLIIEKLERLTRTMQKMHDELVTKADILDALRGADSSLLATKEALQKQTENSKIGDFESNDCAPETKSDAPDIKMEGDGQGQTEACSVVSGGQ
jgi:hypothetical protein